MKRLTHQRVFAGIRYVSLAKRDELITHLAQYEDLGYTPLEIQAIFDHCVTPRGREEALAKLRKGYYSQEKTE